MRIVTFNVNGIRAIREYYKALKRSFDHLLEDVLLADVACLQEHKTNERSKLDHELLSPKLYTSFYAFPKKPRVQGYSGTVTFIKRGLRVRQVEYGISGIYANNPGEIICESSTVRLNVEYTAEELRELDGEARCVITDFGTFILLNIYFPNDGGIERDPFRMSFYNLVRLRCLGFVEAGSSVMVVGDINTTFHPRDHCDYIHAYQSWSGENVAGDDLIHSYLFNGLQSPLPDFIREFYTSEARRWLYKFVHVDKFADVYRKFHPNTDFAFTCWNQKISARGTNYGTRIDGAWCAGPLWEEDGLITGCDLQANVMGSDHCPVFVNLSDDVLKRHELADTSGLKRKCAASTEMRQTRLASFFQVKKSKTEEAKDPPSSTPENAAESSPERAGQASKGTAIIPDKPAPLCRGHDEPCKRMQVRKEGPNRGRWFWMCARPVMGEEAPMVIREDRGKAVTQYQCNFFEWDA